jgi:hypothetical protein
MLGGGVFVTQNKTLPGSYINIVSTPKTSATVGERGIVAMPFELGVAPGTVIELTRTDWVTGAVNTGQFGAGKTNSVVIDEVFCHANKLYIYDINTNMDDTATTILAALEPYEFNVLCPLVDESETEPYITGVKAWRDELGKKCQVVVYSTPKANHEGVINVASTNSDLAVGHYITAWVAGAMAACPVNASCTNMLYDGVAKITPNKTQAQLEQCIKDGEVAFHLVYGEVRLLEDINSLTETTADKGEDFKSNQTIRIVDQIANDISKLFNTKYLGKIPNNDTGRTLLWGDIVKHHRELETMQAIENFDSSLLTVEQGNTKKSIVVNDVITVVNTMSQLYMTIVVQ